MRRLVETLESPSSSHTHNPCDKQLRLFKALYEVAAKYVEVKARPDCGQGVISWPMARQQHAAAFASTTSTDFGAGTFDSGENPATTVAVDAPGNMPSQGEANEGSVGLVNGLSGPTTLHSPGLGDMDMEIDFSGAELWDWFDKSQSIMKMLEDT